jgi:hypothetical protein
MILSRWASAERERAILISSVISIRRNDARQHGGLLSVCASRLMNAPSGKKSRPSQLISS